MHLKKIYLYLLTAHRVGGSHVRGEGSVVGGGEEAAAQPVDSSDGLVLFDGDGGGANSLSDL